MCLITLNTSKRHLSQILSTPFTHPRFREPAVIGCALLLLAAIDSAIAQLACAAGEYSK